MGDGAGSSTVTFLQRFRRGDYADHGQKVLTLNGKNQIVREERLWSAGGWKDGADDPIDARQMTPPLTLTATTIDGTNNGDCRSDDIELALEDSAGHKATRLVGSTQVGLENPDDPGHPGQRAREKPSKGKSP
mgnify:CR=1 FL=1